MEIISIPLVIITVLIIIVLIIEAYILPARKHLSIKKECENIKLKQKQKILELKEKYKNLKPEEIIFSNEVANEAMPYMDSFGASPKDMIIIVLLSELYGYSGKEIDNLIKTARKVAEKAKLQAVKKDINKKANEIYGNIPSDSREPIPEDAQVLVWNRDGGKCVKCGSQEKLEFDHIIPVSKGGSNTARNIQLLCEKCNRSKNDKIGS